MKRLFYAVIVLPLLLTGGVFLWVRQGESKLVASMTVPPPPLGPKIESSDAQALQGQEVFNSKGCVYCHGPNGAGGVKNANSQGGEIPSLTKVGQGFTADELKAKILGGVREIGKEKEDGPTPPLYMPEWKGRLTDAELSAVVAFLMSLSPKGSEEEAF